MLNKIFLIAIVVFGANSKGSSQVDTASIVINSKFPDAWDSQRELRISRNVQILAWTFIKNSNVQYRRCIELISGKDSAGKSYVYLVDRYANDSALRKWDYTHTYIPNYFQNSKTGLKSGYWYLHLETFDRVPTKTEVYELLKKWNFSFFVKNSKTLSAGIDFELWDTTFGFTPNWKFSQ